MGVFEPVQSEFPHVRDNRTCEFDLFSKLVSSKHHLPKHRHMLLSLLEPGGKRRPWLVLTLRLVAETKFAIVYAFSLLGQLVYTRRILHVAHCELAHPECPAGELPDYSISECAGLAQCSLKQHRGLINPIIDYYLEVCGRWSISDP